jgi:hypothetical protein
MALKGDARHDRCDDLHTAHSLVQRRLTLSTRDVLD